MMRELIRASIQVDVGKFLVAKHKRDMLGRPLRLPLDQLIDAQILAGDFGGGVVCRGIRGDVDDGGYEYDGAESRAG